MFTMHGKFQKIQSGGLGVRKFYFSFLQRALLTWSPFQSFWTQRILLHLDVVNNSMSKEIYDNL